MGIAEQTVPVVETRRLLEGMTRGRLLHSGMVAASVTVLAACGAASQENTSGQVSPGGPVELEYWSTNADTTPTEQARIGALKAAEQANPQMFRMKFAEPAGANLTKVVASMAAGTPPNLKVDYPYNAAQLWIKGGLID